ncbi:MAG TPA: NusG domain II-containing protein [Ruminiclostridium sp.]|nr:NusG domain II-containing protein [Ruminiclostridium sp.]
MKFFKKSDILVILVILASGAVLWAIYSNFFASKPAKAEIYYKSLLVRTVTLDTGKDERFSIPQNKNVVFHLASDGRIRFEKSDCPDKICIKTGWLGKVGQTAACLPNKIFLKIVQSDNARNDNGIDMIIGK